MAIPMTRSASAGYLRNTSIIGCRLTPSVATRCLNTSVSPTESRIHSVIRPSNPAMMKAARQPHVVSRAVAADRREGEGEHEGNQRAGIDGEPLPRSGEGPSVGRRELDQEGRGGTEFSASRKPWTSRARTRMIGASTPICS